MSRIEAKSLDQLLHPTFDPEALKAGEVIGEALPASPGAAAGKVYFTAEEAKAAHEAGERVILARLETSPEDIEGMHAAEGILTVRGGMTSHAAVVARGMGTACVSGCGEITMYAHSHSPPVRQTAAPRTSNLLLWDTTLFTMDSTTANAMFSFFSPCPIRLMTSDSAKTVHIELIAVPPPRRASSQISSGRRAIVFAMTSKKRPVPAEHLSFITKSFTRPSSIRMIFVSWPPISMTTSSLPPWSHIAPRA